MKNVSLVNGPNQHYKVQVDGQFFGNLFFDETKHVWVLQTKEDGKTVTKSYYEDLVLSVSQITGNLNAKDK
ncbi:hypothetical protein [Limosilactobacillus difficilis]|uniref:hypothetical protein n=1 Tax=Limosilactobacillus difficilis TaxID=2991838 RepID=UPI0024B9231A|nr:hypothetical protein [Limosilactobacillus difficilis]